MHKEIVLEVFSAGSWRETNEENYLKAINNNVPGRASVWYENNQQMIIMGDNYAGLQKAQEFLYPDRDRKAHIVNELVRIALGAEKIEISPRRVQECFDKFLIDRK